MNNPQSSYIEATRPNQIVLSLADSGKRILAGFIDGSIFAALAGFLYFIIVLLFGSVQLAFSDYDSISNLNSTYPNASLGMMASNLIASLVLGLGVLLTYFVIYILIPTYLFKGQTLGKKFLSLKVIKSDGTDVDLLTLLKRHVIGLFLVLLFIFPCGVCTCCCFVWIYILGNIVKITTDAKKQSLGDSIANTVVIDVQ